MNEYEIDWAATAKRFSDQLYFVRAVAALCVFIHGCAYGECEGE